MFVFGTVADAWVVPVMMVFASRNVLVMLFHSSWAPFTKSVPVTNKVKPSAPAFFERGNWLVKNAGLLSTSNVKGGVAIPPPGPAVWTVTVAKPAVASRVGLRLAVSCTGLL